MMGGGQPRLLRAVIAGVIDVVQNMGDEIDRVDSYGRFIVYNRKGTSIQRLNEKILCTYSDTTQREKWQIRNL